MKKMIYFYMSTLKGSVSHNPSKWNETLPFKFDPWLLGGVGAQILKSVLFLNSASGVLFVLIAAIIWEYLHFPVNPVITDWDNKHPHLVGASHSDLIFEPITVERMVLY